MNYLAHALPFLDRPYFVAGTSAPDWLMVVDRRTRLRAKHLEGFVDDPDPVVAAIAGGIQRHLADDAWFHVTRAFNELLWRMTVEIRNVLGAESGLRPHFLSHLLIEVLLDAALVVEEPKRVDRYYAALDQVDPARIEAVVNRMAPRPAQRLAWFIEVFRRERILWDYREDATLLYRLNQVMGRVKLEPLPASFVDYLSAVRATVAARRDELLGR